MFIYYVICHVPDPCSGSMFRIGLFTRKNPGVLVSFGRTRSSRSKPQPLKCTGQVTGQVRSQARSGHWPGQVTGQVRSLARSGHRPGHRPGQVTGQVRSQARSGHRSGQVRNRNMMVSI